MEEIIFLSAISLKNYGGGEKWIINVGNLLKNKSFKVKVYALSYSPNYRVDENYLRNIIKFDYIEIPFVKSKITPLKMKNLPEVGEGIIYSNAGYYYFLKQILKLKNRNIWGFHDPSLMNPKNYFQKKILNNIIPKFDKIHILNEIQGKIIKNNYVNLLENSYLGDAVPKKEKFDKFTVLFFGRHEEDKGVNTVKYVAENLSDGIDLLIAGSGSQSNKLNIKKGNVKFLGFVSDDDLYEKILKSHLVLFPSYSESSLSFVANESLAHYTPLIYRDIEINKMLEKIPFNLPARKDEEFLNNIYIKYKEYNKDPDLYLKKCYNLPNYLMSKEDYIQLFIEYFLS